MEQLINISITKTNHGFKVKVPFQREQDIVEEFLSQFNQYETKWNPRQRKKMMALKSKYYTWNKHTFEYGIPISQYNAFLKHLAHNGITITAIPTTHLESNFGAPNKVYVHESFNLKEKQVKPCDFITSAGSIKILPAQMGFGKTVLGLYSSAKINMRTVLLAASTHCNAWEKDSKIVYENHSREVVKICGNAALKKLISNAQNGNSLPSFIIITITTFREYLTEYEETGKSTYGCLPMDFFSVIGAGFRISDECHENIHFHFRMAVETNCPKILYLSATIESKKAFNNMLYTTLFPLDSRYTDLVWEKYIKVTALGYTTNRPENIKCIGKSGFYHHATYEQWIMSNKDRFQNYKEMIYFVFLKGFIEKYQPGMKCLIFMATVDICKIMASFLQECHPELKVSAFVHEHDDTVSASNDVLLTTLQKSKSGKDIKGVATIIFTVAVDSQETNIQVNGRLRPISDRWPNVDPMVYYMLNLDIPHHVRYWSSNLRVLRIKSKSVEERRLRFVL